VQLLRVGSERFAAALIDPPDLAPAMQRWIDISANMPRRTLGAG